MATRTEVETWPKATTSRGQVDAERTARLGAGAVSSHITEDAVNWILTTVWRPVVPRGTS